MKPAAGGRHKAKDRGHYTEKRPDRTEHGPQVVAVDDDASDNGGDLGEAAGPRTRHAVDGSRAPPAPGAGAVAPAPTVAHVVIALQFDVHQVATLAAVRGSTSGARGATGACPAKSGAESPEH